MDNYPFIWICNCHMPSVKLKLDDLWVATFLDTSSGQTRHDNKIDRHDSIMCIQYPDRKIDRSIDRSIDS